VENALPRNAEGSAEPRRLPVPGVAAGAVAVAALAASYAPNLAELVRQWSEEPNYSHGFLVAPIALAILWQRRGELDPSRVRPNLLGWVALVAVLAARAYLFERNERWVENATILPALAALTLALGGWRLLWWAAPAIAFLAFMLPLPPSINLILAAPLQRLATIGSTWLLQMTGLPVLAQGNVIFVGGERLEVAQACNGLSMLMSFVTLITAMVILMSRDRPMWERVVLLLSMIPIALVANILRIAATAALYHAFGPEAAMPWPLASWYPTVERFIHDTAGWAMMPIALVLVFLELKVLSWLVVEDEEATAAASARRPLVVAAAMPSGAVAPVKKAAPIVLPTPPGDPRAGRPAPPTADEGASP
jgi:exosortase